MGKVVRGSLYVELCPDITFLCFLTLYSARVTMSKIMQRQLQTENIDPINNTMVRLNWTEYYQVLTLNDMPTYCVVLSVSKIGNKY